MQAFRYYVPDITIGLDTSSSSESIYNTTCHELADASHFVHAGSLY